MTNKEALASVINMAENLYKKDMLNVFPWQHCMRQCVNHILQNDLEITSHQQKALNQMKDYYNDVMED